MTTSAAELDPQALLAQLGAEVAGTLSSALERLDAGALDAGALRALRDEIDVVRRSGVVAQQLVRLAGGGVALATERIELAALLHAALRHRGRTIAQRGVELRVATQPAAVRSDPTLLFSLLQAVLDWTFEHTISRIEIQLSIDTWPEHARLLLRFASDPALDSFSWRLVEQIALLLQLEPQRRHEGAQVELAFVFAETLPRVVDEAPADPDHEGSHEDALRGCPVLALVTRRETRNLLRQALKPTGAGLDLTATLADAERHGEKTPPRAVLVDATLDGELLEALHARHPVAWVQVSDGGRAIEVLNVAGRQVVRVGRDALIELLPDALRFQLARS